jgi:tetratricopeptide (TPR) repeat protein
MPKGLEDSRVHKGSKVTMSSFSLRLARARAKDKSIIGGPGRFTLLATLLGLLYCLNLSSVAADLPGGVQEEIQSARLMVQSAPKDSKLRFAYAESLKKAGYLKEATRQYLEATSIEPTLYVAYHKLCSTNPDAADLDEALNRLNQLKVERPQDLMLRVALSELLEQQGNYYTAARSLVDLVYQNAIPVKYVDKVNARIHFLLSKAKDAHTAEKVDVEPNQDQESAPPPLPESTLKRNLAVSRIKEPKVMQGFGHAQLLP